MVNALVLMPGDIYFGHQPVKVKTLLGSCVAIVLWHPQKRLGGMCHFVLPTRQGIGGLLDARYANDAMQIYIKEMAKHNTRPHEYQAWLFGGASMFSALVKECQTQHATQPRRCEGCKSVACRNRIAALELVNKYELILMESDLGGHHHRLVEFHLGMGKPFLRHHQVTTPKSVVLPAKRLEWL